MCRVSHRHKQLLTGSLASWSPCPAITISGERNQRLRSYKDRDMSTMDSSTIEKVIKDLGLPGRLVEVSGRLITLDLLDDRSEKFERHELGVSEFCDLLLDWRQKLIRREVTATPEQAGVADSTAPVAAEGSAA